MTLEHVFDSASSVMTLISFVTFLGILWWTFSKRRNDDFASAAMLPFADDEYDVADRRSADEESRRV